MASVCIFGSTARNRVDHLSDKDVLVTAPTELELASVATVWSERGWSASRFTHQQLSDMAMRGSLFLQHIKQEGRILRDGDGFLQRLVDNFNPRGDYETDAAESYALLSDVVDFRSSYWPMLCAADIAYGSIRNIAIIRLASRGIYLFDYKQIIDHLAREHGLSSSSVKAFLALRSLKHGYRNRCVSLDPHAIFDDIRSGVGDILGTLKQSYSSMPSGYRGLRRLELFLVENADPRELDRLSNDDPLTEAWTLIRDPRGYPKPKLADEAWLQKMNMLAVRRLAA